MSFFECKHPAAYLGVQKSETVVPTKEYPDEYEVVTYHLYCAKCGEHVNHIGYSRLNALEQAKDDAKQAEFAKRREEFARASLEFDERQSRHREHTAARLGAIRAGKPDPGAMQ